VPRPNELTDRAIRALLWLAAFFFAAGIFLSLTLLLRDIPPTPAVAVGRVTIERASKLRDYVAALLFFVIIGPATIALYRAGVKQIERFRLTVGDAGQQNLISILFVAPFFLAPFLYLTTFKWGWPVLIPLFASQAGPRLVIAYHGTLWFRRILRSALAPFHTLIVVEALAWVLFRYIAVGKRIAHIPTLFLEVVFIVLFVAIFWGALVLIARLATLTAGVDTEVALQRLSIAALPLIALPPMALFFVRGSVAISIVMVTVVVTMIIAVIGENPVEARPVRLLTTYVIVPLLLYCFTYASTASLTQWIDLFHRGESLGPASDYLRGKVPYRDVFVLHGLLQDGLLDSWLMRIFGRSAAIALARPVVLGSFAAPALWYLGMAIFDSIPLSALVVVLGAVTTVDNERVLFEITVLTLLIAALRRRSPALFFASGIAAGVTLFFSFDIGLYAIGGALLTLLALAFVTPSVSEGPGGAGGAEKAHSRTALTSRPLATLGVTTPFLIGVLAGAAPFIVYLMTRGALTAFATTSFVVIPQIIDAVWSLPFPDLTTTFRKNLNLHTISDFFLFEHFRYVLNPLVIGIAVTGLLQRAMRRKSDWLDVALLALTAFAILTQRSALGRADFPHQYFSAFLIGPMIVILLVLLGRATARLWEEGDPAAQAFVCLAAVVLLPLFAVVLWMPDIANARLDDTTHYLGRVSGVGWVDPAAVEIRHRIDQVRYFVTQLSARHAPIFDFSNQPALYFFCDRPNPTRFYQVPIVSPREFQREVILALERTKPPLVIRRSPQAFDVFDDVDNSIRAQAVAGYIDDHYQYANSVRGLEIWTRKPNQSRLNLEAYMGQIRLPSLKELGVVGARARLLFPSVGTLPGVGDAYWRSDLTLHNPFRERMPLSMRYVAGDIRVERRLTLGGGQSILWEDVIRSYFRAPEGRGVLWVEYRGNRPPVARVKTYDSAHNARPSIVTPLTMRDAATAQTENDQLTIVGIPSLPGRRVNIGIVNVGQIPATFRLSVATRTGHRVGRFIEEGLAEDQSYVLTDAERGLRTIFDETSTVRITMVAGTCIAYASVVEPNGDSQLLAAVPSQQP
jgi:hypothetical protein